MQRLLARINEADREVHRFERFYVKSGQMNGICIGCLSQDIKLLYNFF